MIPNFAATTVHEEVVDLVIEVLQLERSEVVLAEIQQFHPILVNFFCRERLEIRVCSFLAICYLGQCYSGQMLLRPMLLWPIVT